MRYSKRSTRLDVARALAVEKATRSRIAQLLRTATNQSIQLAVDTVVVINLVENVLLVLYLPSSKCGFMQVRQIQGAMERRRALAIQKGNRRHNSCLAYTARSGRRRRRRQQLRQALATAVIVVIRRYQIHHPPAQRDILHVALLLLDIAVVERLQDRLTLHARSVLGKGLRQLTGKGRRQKSQSHVDVVA